MNRATWSDRARELLRRASALANESAREEADLRCALEARRQEIEQRCADEHQAMRRQIESDFAQTQQRLQSEAEAEKRQARQEFEHACEAAGERVRQNQQAVEECDARKQRLQAQLDADLASAERSSAEARRRVEATHERERLAAQARDSQVHAREEAQEHFRALYQKHIALCEKHGWRHPTRVESGMQLTRGQTRARSRGDSLETAILLLEEAQGAYAKLCSFVGFYRGTFLTAVGLCLCAVVLLFVAGKAGGMLPWVAVAVVAALAVVGLFSIILNMLWVDRWTAELNGCRQEGERMLTRLAVAPKAEQKRYLSEIWMREERDLEQIDQQLRQKRAVLEQQHAEAVRLAEAHCDLQQVAVNEPAAALQIRQLQEIDVRQEEVLRWAAAERDRRLAKIDSDFAERSEEAWAGAGPSSENCAADSRARRQADLARADAEHRKALERLRADWNAGLARLRGESSDLFGEVRHSFPDWHFLDRQGRQPLEPSPEVLPIGVFPVAMNFPGGVLEESGCPLPVPALVPFPDHCSMLFTAAGAGQDRAATHLRAIALRILTALPPGKVRFTFIDPVALGEHFAPFLHLADHDETLVSGRVWTEPRQIEQQLEALAEHMTHVIQMYLRGQYPTIGEYNARAGEVAEPYRFLVVAGFPAGFTPDALRRLQSIVAAGPRCGINTLLLVDRSLALPAGFDPEGLRRHFICFDQQETHGGACFVRPEDDFASWPLELEQPPDIEVFNCLLHEVGRLAREGSGVRVPFETVAPAAERWWSADSRSELSVPLGRAGAVRLQELCLGRGVAQHVLVAGKTGSGKSTLLHALIVNLALHYSPHEVELYLIDFKKGVEFKPYALHELPHARVIAIESEREFGVSVLQRLDAEMRSRGELFRQADVRGLESYRNTCPERPLPRIVLLVDEFQEFFIDEDRIAREASMLLDRLVRQGRAFGIHVVLGSQTLAGAYSLTRATLGQMAVRIALPCNDADGRLILGEDNAGARLLSRPGQAIYNDANGDEASNSVFQTAWLPDDQRDLYLEHLRRLGRERKIGPLPQVVFEGNVSPEVGQNRPLYDLLASGAGGAAAGTAKAWLGDPVAIAQPMAAVFERQSGNNLATIGAGDDVALGMALTALVSLAASSGGRAAPSAARLYLVNALPFAERHQPLLTLAGRLLSRSAGRRDAAEIVDEVAAAVDQRLATGGEGAGPMYLLLVGMQHLRDLRRSDEDAGSFRGVGLAGPAGRLAKVLRDGPGVGVFTLVWSDTLAGVQRCLDRQGLREFALRVAFQMNAGDSTTLIDTPQAGKLGPCAALYSNEQQGRLDKFRPYGLPDYNWLAWAVGRLAAGS